MLNICAAQRVLPIPGLHLLKVPCTKCPDVINLRDLFLGMRQVSSAEASAICQCLNESLMISAFPFGSHGSQVVVPLAEITLMSKMLGRCWFEGMASMI